MIDMSNPEPQPTDSPPPSEAQSVDTSPGTPPGPPSRGSRPTWGERLRNPRWWARELKSWALMLILIVVFSLALGAFRAPDLSGEAPDFELRSLGGETVRLSDFRGRTVVLNFWATWCPPCRVELPSFVRFARNNPDIVVLGLAVQSPPEALEAMVRDQGIGYPVLLVDEALSQSYPVRSLPTTIVIGPEGRIEAAHSGILFRPMLWWMTR